MSTVDFFQISLVIAVVVSIHNGHVDACWGWKNSKPGTPRPSTSTATTTRSATTTTTTSSTTTPTAGGECRNYRNDCDHLARERYCTRHSFMRTQCPKACNFCIDECRNHRNDCDHLARERYCTRHSFMKTQCPKACNFCIDTSKPSTTTRRPATTTTTRSTAGGGCRNYRNDCDHLAREQYCTRHSFMRKQCPKACNFCIGNIGKN